jgi:hypothetical protein
MTSRRGLLLAWIVAGCVIGLYLRSSAPAATPQREPRLDFLARPDLVDKAVGPFTIERLDDEDRFTLWLRSERCDGAIVLSAGHVERAPSEQAMAARFPSSAWRTLYVHDDRSYQDFPRLLAYLRFIARRLAAQLTHAPLSLSDLAFFTFHTPAHCSLDASSAIAASKALIGLARIQGE